MALTLDINGFARNGSGHQVQLRLYSRVDVDIVTLRLTVKAIKPKASRDRSSETFLVGIGLKAGAQARASGADIPA